MHAIIPELSFANWVRPVIGIAVFVPVFITATLLTRTIDRVDISNLREMFNALGPLR